MRPGLSFLISYIIMHFFFNDSLIQLNVSSVSKMEAAPQCLTILAMWLELKYSMFYIHLSKQMMEAVSKPSVLPT